MTNASEVMAGLNPKTLKRVHAASETEVTFQKVPSVSMTMALHGGLGYGRQTLIWGNKSSGKSSFCLQMVAMAQQEGKVCSWIDVENSYDPLWAGRLGVNSEDLILSPTKVIDDVVDVGVDLMRNGVDVLVVDSISSLLSSAYFDKSNDLKSLGETGQIGADAREMARAVRMLNYANENTAIVLISQLRNKLLQHGAMHIPTGGEAVKFFSSTSIKLTSSARADDQIKGEVFVGNKIFEQPVGRKVNWLIDYNKLGPPNQTGTYAFYYDGDSIGVDPIEETLDLAEKFSVIERGGAWYTIEGARVQGKPKAVQLLRSEPDLYDRIVKELYEQIPKQ